MYIYICIYIYTGITGEAYIHEEMELRRRVLTRTMCPLWWGSRSQSCACKSSFNHMMAALCEVAYKSPAPPLCPAALHLPAP